MATIAYRRERAYPLVAWIWCFLIFTAALGHPGIQERTSLMVYPALSLLAGIGTREVWRACKRLVPDSRLAMLLSTAVVATPFAACAIAIAATPSRTAYVPEKTMVEWIQDHVPSGAMIISNFPLGILASSPGLSTWTVVNIQTFVVRSAEADDFTEYLEWRYPSYSPTTSTIVLAVSERDDVEAYGELASDAIESHLAAPWAFQRRLVSNQSWSDGLLVVWSRRHSSGVRHPQGNPMRSHRTAGDPLSR